MVRKQYGLVISILLVGVMLTLSACAAVAPAAPAAPAADATAAPAAEAPVAEEMSPEMAALVEAAQAEGELTVIALPRNWCNYGAAIDGFSEKYGITVNELNPDAGSGDELEAIRANKDNVGPQAPDVIDVGFAFGTIAKDEGLIQPYKVSTWDTIPDDVKDPDGYWYGDYYGVLAFMVNNDIIPEAPADWDDLLDPKYNGQVALSGDPRTSNQAILSVMAADLARSGDMDDVMPGIEYFAELNQAGNLVPVISNNALVARGETPVRITWDYLALSGADEMAGNPPVSVVIPESGRVAGVYVQAISAYAPHPNAAKLWQEYLYSDEGQLHWMSGYCHPIREPDLRARGVVPAELAAKLPDVTGAEFPTIPQQDAAKAVIVESWDSTVGATISDQ
jgi:putative spermidine/putrescine transport system substrate-binding protein